MGFDSILLDILRSRGQERFKIEPMQEEAPQRIVLDGQDCVIILPKDRIRYIADLSASTFTI